MRRSHGWRLASMLGPERRSAAALRCASAFRSSSSFRSRAGQTRNRINTPENCVDLTRQTSLLQLIWLIRVARFIVSVESGPMHIAAAVTGNLLSIHTWTDPRRIGPYNPDAWVWKHGKLLRVDE